jgi:chorismate mutase
MSAQVRPLEELRREIEQIDRDLVQLIARRIELARDAGRRKRAAGQPTLDPAREAEVVRRAGQFAREANVPEEEVREIFWHLIGLSRRAQADTSA